MEVSPAFDGRIIGSRSFTFLPGVPLIKRRIILRTPLSPSACNSNDTSSPHSTATPPPLSLHRVSQSLSVHSSPFASSGTYMMPPSIGDDLPSSYVDDDPFKNAPPRRAGVLLHPTSLPGPFGIGDLGKQAFTFIDWLCSAGCTVWQVLPLVPPGRKSGEDGSPYSGQDANCGNTLLISLEALVHDGLLEDFDLPKPIPVAKVDFEAVAALKDPLLAKAAKKLIDDKGPLKSEMENFRKQPVISAWLEDAALFAAIDAAIDEEFWWDWPKPLRDRNPKALGDVRKEQKTFIEIFIAKQFLFQRQWQALHRYANSKGIRIIGDMPIYVGGHSADVWANRSQFELDDATGQPHLVSGVPPDAFSATGQRWGSPLYNWKKMDKDGYSWWIKRMKRAFDLYDEFRIDHFRGLAGYWAIPAESPTAMVGSWKMGPREKFFAAIKAAVGKVDIIAEDLGIITGDVVKLRKAINAPGMAVLQFAFGGGPGNPYLLHNHEADQVVYPGTHDNDTVLGWWKRISSEEKQTVLQYLHVEDEDDISWVLIDAALSSVCRTAIIPMQDIMCLDNSARMNTPAVQYGNWGWRIGEAGSIEKLENEARRLKSLITQYDRLVR
ncbi:hypothetical protein KP509_08G046700 [Ceratopteris richardii]|uniref:4-alpha-glucanotransferase n=1 Tax=Ceratopteris richardii TaxID=49495 RepID=A0A8T2UA62_CERRI|nr:hypothetical protein KP509_08G046700 [Ceratopteris richardii]